MLVKLEAYHDGEFWHARGIGESVIAQGETFEELLDNVREALASHFEEKLEKGEELEISILTQTDIKGEFDSSKSQGVPQLIGIKKPNAEGPWSSICCN